MTNKVIGLEIGNWTLEIRRPGTRSPFSILQSPLSNHSFPQMPLDSVAVGEGGVQPVKEIHYAIAGQWFTVMPTQSFVQSCAILVTVLRSTSNTLIVRFGDTCEAERLGLLTYWVSLPRMVLAWRNR